MFVVEEQPAQVVVTCPVRIDAEYRWEKKSSRHKLWVAETKDRQLKFTLTAQWVRLYKNRKGTLRGHALRYMRKQLDCIAFSHEEEQLRILFADSAMLFIELAGSYNKETRRIRRRELRKLVRSATRRFQDEALELMQVARYAWETFDKEKREE